MTNFIKTFRADESGAVTVDWVVLTAAVVGLGLAVMAVIGPKMGGVAERIGSGLDDARTMNFDYGVTAEPNT
ncbi:MAG: hypothetical protein H3C51_08535 [Rubellimicrobium sp.]|nr:hypothetical protein [Rubellimicrobium sp.]